MSYFYVTRGTLHAARVLAGRTDYLAVKCQGVDFHMSNNLRDIGKAVPTVQVCRKYIKKVLAKLKRSK